MKYEIINFCYGKTPKSENYNMGYIYTFIIICIIIVTISLHKLLKGWWRQIKKDRLLDDTQALREYERAKMEAEIEELKKEVKELKKDKEEG